MISLIKICPDCGDVNIVKIPFKVYERYVINDNSLDDLADFWKQSTHSQRIGFISGVHLKCYQEQLDNILELMSGTGH